MPNLYGRSKFLTKKCSSLKPVYMIGVYIPPCESPAYRVTENRSGIEPLEQCLLDLQEKCSYFHFIIFGDKNSRRGDNNGMLESPADGMHSDEAEECFRTSKDPTVNAFGQQLLDLCSVFECSIVNGLCDKRLDDGLTFISQTGGSVVDYFIVSNELCVFPVVL